MKKQGPGRVGKVFNILQELYEKKKEQGERHLKTCNRMAIFKKRLKDYKEDFIFYTSLRFSLLRDLECIPHLSQGAEI